MSDDSISRVINCLAGECLDENLHSAAQTEDEMERRLLLDVVVRKSAAVLELLAAVGREEYPPCPVSSSSHCRWYR